MNENINALPVTLFELPSYYINAMKLLAVCQNTAQLLPTE